MQSQAETNKRKTTRIPHVADIRYCAPDHDDYRPARMYNYSPDGMYLELRYPPPKFGANLLIEVLDQADLDPLLDNCAPKVSYYAQVIWKKNLPETVAGYGVGLRYLHPASMA